MDIIRNAIVEWEPLVAKARFVNSSTPDPVDFQDKCISFMTNRGKSCSCGFVFFQIISFGRKTIEFIAERFCNECLPAFCSELASAFGDDVQLTIGVDCDEKECTTDKSMVHIPSADVMMEDGRLIHVAPFEIATRPVSIGEFREFTEGIGYLTTAEQRGEPDTYLTDSNLARLSASQLARTEVNNVSFIDAVAYCKWAHVRLPSEEEWLAAFISDSKTTRQSRSTSPRMVAIGAEWTATHVKSGSVVIRRSRSVLAIDQRRKKLASIRFVVRPHHYDPMTTFRVVSRRSISSADLPRQG